MGLRARLWVVMENTPRKQGAEGRVCFWVQCPTWLLPCLWEAKQDEHIREHVAEQSYPAGRAG